MRSRRQRFYRLVIVATAAGFSLLPLNASADVQGATAPKLGLATPARSLYRAQPPAPLAYHWGPVLHSTRSIALFWVPPGFTVDAGYESTISDFLANLAAASGRPDNVYAADTQYWDATGQVTSSSTFAGAVVDTRPFPANGCADPYTTVCLTDSQLGAEVAAQAAAGDWSADDSTIVFLFTPEGVGSCFDQTSTTCAFREYCAYHTWTLASGSRRLLWANLPYADTLPSACDSGQHPNGTDADATLNVLGHETRETITDPYGSAWYDKAGQESSDKCAWSFGAALGTTAYGSYNQVLGSGRYYLQQEWSNASGSCVQAYAGGAPPAPTIDAVSPGQAVPGSVVTVTGTGFTGLTTAKVNGVKAAFKVLSGTSVSLTVPKTATTGPIMVATSWGLTTSDGSLAVQPVVNGFTPSGSAAGTTVTISGAGLGGATSVRFNGVTAPIASVSATAVKTKVPAGATSGPISVTTAGGTASSAAAFIVTS